ncbi:MAG: Gp138 family membrane-puncturing spike protein [Cellulosilyticaceae bacterium]
MIGRTIDYGATLKLVKDSISSINTMFLGTITSVDIARQRYGVQPILMLRGKDETFTKRAVIAHCPMSFIKTSTFYVRAPYEIGDMVFVGCNKESIDEAVIDGSVKESRADGVSLFREVDGVIIGGVMSDSEPELTSDYANDFIIQNRKNGDLVSIKKDGGVKIVSASKVEIVSPMTEIQGKLHVTADVTMDANLNVSGNINVAGSGTIGTVQTSKGTTLDDHTHVYSPGSNPPTNTGTGVG